MCQNGGTCEPDKKYPNATCLCLDEQYEGKFCEIGIIAFWLLHTFHHAHVQTRIFIRLSSLDKCSPDGNHLCKNGGTCYIKPGGNAACRCTKEYVGDHCEDGKK